MPSQYRSWKRSASCLEQEPGPAACSLAAGLLGVPEEGGPPIQQVSVDGAMIPLVHKQWVEGKTRTIGTVQPPKRQADGTFAIHATDLSYFSRVADCHTFTPQATIEIVRRGILTAGTVCGVEVSKYPWLYLAFTSRPNPATRL